MNYLRSQMLRKFIFRPGTSINYVRTEVQALGATAPDDYCDFMLQSNGAEGFLENDFFLMIYAVEQLRPCNEPYRISIPSPFAVIFGSDGGSKLFGFDIRTGHSGIISFDAIEMDRGSIEVLGASFDGFLSSLGAIRFNDS